MTATAQDLSEREADSNVITALKDLREAGLESAFWDGVAAQLDDEPPHL